MKGELVSSMVFPCQKLFLYLSQPWKFGIDNRDRKEYHPKLYYLSWNSLDIVLI